MCMELNAVSYILCPTHSQVITVHRISLLVTMEGAFLITIGVTTIMTVEITVMKMDAVCDVKWEKTLFYTAV